MSAGDKIMCGFAFGAVVALAFLAGGLFQKDRDELYHRVSNNWSEFYRKTSDLQDEVRRLKYELQTLREARRKPSPACERN